MTVAPTRGSTRAREGAVREGRITDHEAGGLLSFRRRGLKRARAFGRGPRGVIPQAESGMLSTQYWALITEYWILSTKYSVLTTLSPPLPTAFCGDNGPSTA